MVIVDDWPPMKPKTEPDGVCRDDILGSGILCVRRKGHTFPNGKKLCTGHEELARWLDDHEKPYRVPLSDAVRAQLRERMSDERPGVRLGDQMHGPWCELAHEENRWWEVFVSVLNPASRPWLRGSDKHLAVGGDESEGADHCIFNAATFADQAIAEAKSRGRL